MKGRDLLRAPLWEAKHLGKAIPQSPHAVSVALPHWENVIAYEEQDPKCINSLQSIYPRFGLNPLVQLIADQAISLRNETANSSWPFPNIKTAQKAKEHCKRINPKALLEIQKFSGLQCLIVDAITTPIAKSFWQHTGLGASSREASIALKKQNPPSRKEGEEARESIKNRLAAIYQCDKDLIELHPSGMAAFTTALEALEKLKPKQPVLQLGFPYVDVLKLPEVIFNGSELILNPKPEELAKQLEKRNPSALIVELPSNPMLQCVDLALISKIAHEKGILVIADDTIGSAVNIDPLPYADLIFTSLTKSFSGRGDIMAGSLIISPKSQWREALRKIIPLVSVANLSDADSIELDSASQDINSRIHQLNKNCFQLKNLLEKHPDISRVLHPANCPNFKSLMKNNAGFGCLLSFELNGDLSRTKRFYNSLEICKGPSLGTIFSLACPYVLLAHYKELEWAEKCGVPSRLIRVSVGLEKVEDLWNRFRNALNK